MTRATSEPELRTRNKAAKGFLSVDFGDGIDGDGEHGCLQSHHRTRTTSQSVGCVCWNVYVWDLGFPQVPQRWTLMSLTVDGSQGRRQDDVYIDCLL